MSRTAAGRRSLERRSKVFERTAPFTTKISRTKKVRSQAPKGRAALDAERFSQWLVSIRIAAIANQFHGNSMTPAPIKPEITLADLARIDIRIGTVLAVMDVPGADKLVQLRVSFGDHERTILSGMKTERADPREIEGRQALFVVNLPPRKMKGVLSEGMVFDLGFEDGVTPVLAVPEAPVPDGTRAG
jgi:tRNA-binding protein